MAERKIKNLEQIRAKVALEAAGKIGTGSEGGKAVAKKVPAQIVQNGLLASLAFAIEKSKNDGLVLDADGYYRKGDGFQKCGYANTFVSVMEDLRKTGNDLGICQGDLSDWFKKLCDKSSVELRRVTEEALAYLNYLRRFAKSDAKKSQQGQGGE